jgi:hypothetical protein
MLGKKLWQQSNKVLRTNENPNYAAIKLYCSLKIEVMKHLMLHGLALLLPRFIGATLIPILSHS